MGEMIGLVASLLGIGAAIWAGLAWVRANKQTIVKLNPLGGGELSIYIKKKKWRIGIAHYPPLSFVSTDPDSGDFVFSGPVVELASRLCKKLGKDVEFLPVRWDRLESHFRDDDCDILAPIFPTEKRSVFGRLAAPMYSVGLGAVSKKINGDISSPTDLMLRSIRIGVIEGEVGWEYLAAELPTKLASVNTSISKSYDITDIMHSVIDGRVDVAIADSISCQRFILQNDPSKTKLHNPFLNQPLRIYSAGFMVRSEDIKFATWLNVLISELRLSNDFLKLEAQELEGWGKQIFRLNIPEGLAVPKIN